MFFRVCVSLLFGEPLLIDRHLHSSWICVHVTRWRISHLLGRLPGDEQKLDRLGKEPYTRSLSWYSESTARDYIPTSSRLLLSWLSPPSDRSIDAPDPIALDPTDVFDPRLFTCRKVALSFSFFLSDHFEILSFSFFTRLDGPSYSNDFPPFFFLKPLSVFFLLYRDWLAT